MFRVLCLLVLAVFLLGDVSTGNAAAPVSSADQVCPPTTDPCVVKSALTVANGSTLDFGTRTLSIASTGKLDAGSGSLTINAGALNIDPSGRILARGSGSDSGGFVAIDVGSDATINGAVDVSGDGGGSLLVTVGGHLTLAGRISIVADGTSSDANGGSVSLQADTIDIDGPLSAQAGSQGSGGSVSVTAATHIRITDTVDVSGGNGGSGTLSIDSGGDLELISGGALRANGANGGSSDSINLTAGDDTVGSGVGSLLLAGSISLAGGDSTDGGGDGGTLTLTASRDCRIDSKVDATSGQGSATGGCVMFNCGSDGSNTTAVSAAIDVSGNGGGSSGGMIQLTGTGTITVSDRLLARGGTDSDGGAINISSGGDVQLTGTAALRVGASGSGSAGSILINSGAGLVADGTIAADGGDNPEGGGDGGSVELDASDQCQISVDISATSGAVDASGGSVTIECGQDVESPAGVSGQIDASGSGQDSEGGSISIATSGTLALTGTLLAKGGANATAGDIALNADDSLVVSGTVRVDAVGQASAGTISFSSGTTMNLSGTSSAVGGSDPNGAGDGGSVTIDADGLCNLTAQIFTTSGQPDG
ncbi:MAG TPA: hypothetical protein VMT89_17275, partial [Candidatus Acidoferrales bacterium]|nr:hypothetical protein [Candidatus Acidoferrales bacterium]